jgi:hypothetical protein
MKARGEGMEVEFYSFFNVDTKRRWFVNAMRRPLYPRRRTLAFFV